MGPEVSFADDLSCSSFELCAPAATNDVEGYRSMLSLSFFCPCFCWRGSSRTVALLASPGKDHRCQTRQCNRSCLCLISSVLFVGVALVIRWGNERSNSCLKCPSVYYAATACALGGQTLRRVGWSSLYSLLAPGASFRVDLESILASAEFMEKARCPRWTVWDAEMRACIGSSKMSGKCHADVGSWRDDHTLSGSSRPASNSSVCTSNLVWRRNLDADHEDPFFVVAVACAQTWQEIDMAKEHVLPISKEAGQIDPGKWAYDAASNKLTYIEGSNGGAARCATALSHYGHVTLDACSDIAEQQWWLDNEQFVHVETGQCMNIYGGLSAKVALYPCSEDQTNDHFVLNDGLLADRATPQNCLEARRIRHRYFGRGGGTCTCPDGRSYIASDFDTECRVLACAGGRPGICDRKASLTWESTNSEVVCQPDVLGAARLAEGFADPARDTACWVGRLPLFVWPYFLRGCPGYAPDFTELPETAKLSKFEIRPSGKNLNPQVFSHGEFGLFYEAFYATAAGDLCKARFGGPRPAVPLTEPANVSVLFGNRQLSPVKAVNWATWNWQDTVGAYQEVPNELLGSTFFVANREDAWMDAGGPMKPARIAVEERWLYLERW
eukprot:TRINITY_DN13576_c0_g1_i1.p1 TRINITY_DN13576_c0_g1~~TRINITY_DN13576_c0_g1_i1.p1  ORF type:complete len:613 (-),score=85.17 TRINITY_DN13576_c0_g1_i1:251-2089(-)